MDDLPEGISETFQECQQCGGYFVKVASHRCADPRGDTTDPDRDERRRRAAEDERPDGDSVAILPTRSVSGSYAYHEIDADGLPECGGGGVRTHDEWIRLSRAEAKARGKAPCGTCRRLTGDRTAPTDRTDRTDSPDRTAGVSRDRDTGRQSGR